MTTLRITSFIDRRIEGYLKISFTSSRGFVLWVLHTTIIPLLFILSPVIAFGQFSYISAGAGQVEVERAYAIDWAIGYDVFASGPGISKFTDSEEPKISVYPNPFSNECSIQLPFGIQQKNIRIQIKDSFNRVVWSAFRQKVVARERLSLPSLPAGVYGLQIIIPEESTAHSIQIIKVSSDLK
ncbi:MAG: hypothetical protein HRU40_19305 [Saprospiraceae bacterium]|nr:hypothetical protein [Saprospiraceae bacterium]